MKNGLIIWNVVLTLLVGWLLFAQFGSKKKTVKGSYAAVNDTSSNKQFRIAYFEMDSVAANFVLAKEFKTDVQVKEDAMNTEMEGLSKNLQQKYNFYQNKAQAGSLSQAESEAASMELKKMDDDMKIRKQQLDQEYNDFVLRRQNEIKNKIKDFMKEYNKEKSYTYIFSDDPGLFYYQDTVYNITGDVVRGLNEFYKSKKK